MSLPVNDEVDIQVVEQTSIDGETAQMTMIAKLAAQVLNKHYPNHWWCVGWMPGMALCIKHGMGDSRYGFTVDAAKAATISELEHAIIYGGGELLERMGMPRGAWDGEREAQSYAM